MSAAIRMRVLVGLVALAAGGAVAGVVLATRQSPAQPKAQCRPQAPVIVPGVGAPAATAAVRAARGRLQPLQALANRYPRDPVVQFNYAVALECRGYLTDAVTAFETTKRVGADTQYRIAADQLLHPQFFQGGYPMFEPLGRDPLLLRGAVEQRAGHQVSAERLYARAARLHPNEAEAQVAAAVARFDEDNLSASFSRLGPLTRRFPHSQSVRYHLGLLLVWTGQGKQAIRELRLAYALGPKSPLGREAGAILKKLVANGSTRTKK
jgi:tetratricopeptide (TPR) repeat protein